MGKFVWWVSKGHITGFGYYFYILCGGLIHAPHRYTLWTLACVLNLVFFLLFALEKVHFSEGELWPP